MIRGIYTSALGMMTRLEQMSVVSNNLANVNTNGFKKEQTVFKELPKMDLHRTRDNLIETPEGFIDLAPPIGGLGTGVVVDETATDFTQGIIQTTANPFDLAILGEGFFVLNKGTERYFTRAGNFTRDDQGYLTNLQGYRLEGLNKEHQKIHINVGTKPFIVKENGEIYQDDGEYLGRILVANVQNLKGLVKTGENLYKKHPAAGTETEVIAGTRVKQGFLEKSNVNVIREMVEMIEVNRSYEANQRVLKTQDDLLQKAVNDVARGF